MASGYYPSEMKAVMKDPNRHPQSRLSRAIVFMALLIMAVTCAACTDEYEPTKSIEGVYRPSHCVTLQGIIPGRVLHHETIHPTVCQPMRVSELGVYTYGWGWSAPGEQREVAKLEFSDAGVLVETDDLRASGTFDYKDRDTTPEEWVSNNPFKTIFFVLVGLGITIAIWQGWKAIESRRQRERERLEAEVAREADAVARAAAVQKAILALLRRLISEANRAAASLPIILGEAELILNRADDELRSQLPSPFWEAMEEALEKLQGFEGAMATIEARRAEYCRQVSNLDAEAPRFRLDSAVLPDPTSTQSRLTHLYRQAQAIPHFSIVYEQRRTTSAVVAGFRSLGQAVEQLGHRIVNEISGLAVSLDSRMDSLEKSLESSAAAAAEQSAALRAQLQNAAGTNEMLGRQLHQDAEAHTETERRALRMLDNIQHRRKPSIFEAP